jgi:hypothetical protein
MYMKKYFPTQILTTSYLFLSVQYRIDFIKAVDKPQQISQLACMHSIVFLKINATCSYSLKIVGDVSVQMSRSRCGCAVVLFRCSWWVVWISKALSCYIKGTETQKFRFDNLVKVFHDGDITCTKMIRYSCLIYEPLLKRLIVKASGIFITVCHIELRNSSYPDMFDAVL